MDPNVDRQTGYNLPTPAEGSATLSAEHASETLPQAPEIAPLPQGSVSATIPSVPLVPVITPAPVASVDDVNSTTIIATNSAPTVADDADLIEKEWVHKAKEIVEKTKEDPYTQNQELSKFKADYMQKRYNKVIKLSE